MRITNDKHRRIISMYQDGSTTKEIADKFGMTQRGVTYVLNKYNVRLIERRRTNGRRINVNFFKRWTSEMAYVLGFVYTDGNVSGNTLSISQKDRSILEKINDVMDSDFPIRERTINVYSIDISRKVIVDDLRKLGVVEGKTHIMTFPDVPDEYLPHFIRGVVDGDGWIQERGYVMNVTNASESFSYSLLKTFQQRNLNARISKQNNAYRVFVSGKQDVINLADWIYADCGDLYLPRKRERFYVNKKTPAQRYRQTSTYTSSICSDSIPI